MTTLHQIEELREKQFDFFASGITKDISFRKNSLKRLRASVLRNEEKIRDALRKDLNKPSFEVYATETGFVLHELSLHLKNISRWTRARRVGTPLFSQPAVSYIKPEPFGRVFIISPWNYPFQMAMVPLIGAVAAGNVVVLRQSRSVPHINGVIAEILAESFDREHVAMIESDINTAEKALLMKWEMIFFTGSTSVGKQVYKEAALNLTPVVLELGGKSPAVIDEDANITLAARRIAWGKMVNAGQTCISPDYLFVHSSVVEDFLVKLKQEFESMCGSDAVNNPDYPRMISEKAFDRLVCLLENTRILHGGQYDRGKLSIAPTIIEGDINHVTMKDEIFGPILPVLSFTDLDTVISFINSKPKPLAVYYFSGNKKQHRKMIEKTSSGACLINEVIVHIANSKLPFGGVGDSGHGRYHGRESIRAFSNMKAVMKSTTLIDIPLKYPPYGNKERFLRWFLK